MSVDCSYVDANFVHKKLNLVTIIMPSRQAWQSGQARETLEPHEILYGAQHKLGLALMPTPTLRSPVEERDITRKPVLARPSHRLLRVLHPFDVWRNTSAMLL